MNLCDRLMWSRVLTLLTGLMAAATPPAAALQIDTLALEQHARFLADDLLEGRGPASRGERIAALYLTTHAAGMGLKPLPGQADHRLPVPLTAVLMHEERVLARVTGAATGTATGATRTLRPPSFYHPGGSRLAFRDFAGELLFAGAVASAPAALAAYDDLAGTVVVLTPPWSGFTELEVELVRRGAAGAVLLIADSTVYERLRIVRGPTRYHLPDGIEDRANQGHLPSVVGGPALIRALGLETDVGPGRTIERARPLDRRLTVELPWTAEPRTGYNVAAYLPGADPVRRDEWVVFVAHYDHVGFGEPAGGDSIWNGFIDNAAGSAMLLEIARALAAEPPARSVAFVWVTAEEQGLLGSNWFVHQPPIPLDRIHAVINLDGGAPPAPPTSWGVVGADASAAGATTRRVVERHGWSVRDVAFGPQSDHWPFHLAGVPTVMLFPGGDLEGLSRDEADALTQRWLRPHTPHDEWSPDFPLAGLGRYADLALAIGRALASAEPDSETGYATATVGTRWLENDAGVSIRVLVEALSLGGDEVEVGEITFPPGTGANHRPHSHSRVELLYVLSGRLVHIVGDEAHTLEPGMMGIVRPGDSVVHHVPGDAPVRALVIWAPGGELERLAPFFRERRIERPDSLARPPRAPED